MGREIFRVQTIINKNIMIITNHGVWLGGLTDQPMLKNLGYVQGPENKVERGDVDAQMQQCDQVLEGSVVVGSQEHFYLEPQVSVVDPQENDELVIHASTQVYARAHTPPPPPPPMQPRCPNCHVSCSSCSPLETPALLLAMLLEGACSKSGLGIASLMVIAQGSLLPPTGKRLQLKVFAMPLAL